MGTFFFHAAAGKTFGLTIFRKVLLFENKNHLGWQFEINVSNFLKSFGINKKIHFSKCIKNVRQHLYYQYRTFDFRIIAFSRKDEIKST